MVGKIMFVYLVGKVFYFVYFVGWGGWFVWYDGVFMGVEFRFIVVDGSGSVGSFWVGFGVWGNSFFFFVFSGMFC